MNILNNLEPMLNRIEASTTSMVNNLEPMFSQIESTVKSTVGSAMETVESTFTQGWKNKPFVRELVRQHVLVREQEQNKNIKILRFIEQEQNENKKNIFAIEQEQNKF